MPGWDIQPAGVRGVLGQTEGVASEFDGQLAGWNAARQEAVGQSSSTIVAGALEGFAEAQAASVGFVFTRTGAAVNGAGQATNAYVEGDLEMAANAQAAVSAAPDPRAAMPGGGAGPR
ncbi:MAG: hypothetical protein GEU83_01500 [Pseudonocardiaceae bacterium]|nr:hypothetical protein [Pseudonocardiaceae bacterium]